MFRGIFSNKEQQAADAAKAAAASRQANAPTRPPNAVQPPGVPGGVMPTIPSFHPTSSSSSYPSSHAPSNSRPDPNALATARKARQAALAAAAFGTPAVPLASSTVQPPRAQAPGTPQQTPGFLGGPPGGFGGDSPGGDMGGGGDDGFDMFGGLDVKAAPGPSMPASSSFHALPPSSSSSLPTTESEGDSSLLSALNSGGAEEASGFSFISDDTPADPSADSSGFSFISADEPAAPQYDEPSYGLPSPSAAVHGGDKLASSKAHIDRCLSAFWVEWRSLAASESGLKQEEVQLQLSIRDSIAAVKETEDKQGAAVAAEEYERADSYNSEIDRLKGAIGSAQERLKAVRAEIDAKEQHKQRAAQAIVQVLTDATAQFEALTTEKAGELSTFVSTQVASLKETDSAVTADLARVEYALSHTQGELDAIAKEDEQLSEALKHETQPFVDEREALLEDEHRLEVELQELKRQVAAKEKEIAANKDKQRSADRAVEVVRAKNAQQRVAIQQKRAKVDDSRSRDVNEKRQVERRRQQLDEEIANNKRRERDYRLALHDLASQLAHAQYLSSLIQTESKQREAFHSSLRTAEQQISALQHTLDSHDENQGKARADLLQLEQQLDQHTKSIQAIASKIPAMESEKNAAVAARDFKKAATASKEIKTLQQSKTDSEAVIEELKAKVDKYSAELGGADEKKADIEREMRRLEEDTDRKRLQFSLKREAKLQRRQQTASELLQKAFGLGHGGDGLDHLQKEVESVAVELQWTQVEVRELRGKHGWKEGDVGPAADEDEEDEEAEVVSHVDDPSPFDSIRGAAVTNGLTASTSLGVPVLAPRKSSSASSLSSHPSAAPTQADLDAVRQSLTDANGRLSSYEAKLSEALESEDYEAAEELNAKISAEKDAVTALETRLKDIEKALAVAAPPHSDERKEEDFEEFAED